MTYRLHYTASVTAPLVGAQMGRMGEIWALGSNGAHGHHWCASVVFPVFFMDIVISWSKHIRVFTKWYWWITPNGAQ
jgi:hypothetical protein